MAGRAAVFSFSNSTDEMTNVASEFTPNGATRMRFRDSSHKETFPFNRRAKRCTLMYLRQTINHLP